MIKNRKAYAIPAFIPEEVFRSLNWKEQDFMLLFYSGRHTREEICRMLYVPSRSWYWRIRKKVTDILKTHWSTVHFWNEHW